MSTAAALAKAALFLLTDEGTRKKIGWLLVALLSPVILVLAFLFSLASGTASHNTSAAELCFYGGELPSAFPAEYRTYVQEMRNSFEQLDQNIAEINGQTEEGVTLDAVRVKAMFYALFFGEEQPNRRANKNFSDCFVTYEERTKTVTTIGQRGEVTVTEETYTVAVPIAELNTVWENIISAMSVVADPEIRGNADSVYNLIQYGWACNGGSGAWNGDIGGPILSVDGFYSPLGAGWRTMISSDYGQRICPYHGTEFHSGLDMAAASGTPIRAALAGTVIKSCYTGSYGNYTVIDHGNGMTTAYAHQSRRLVKVGDAVEVGEVIGLVGSTGNSTGPHLHLEVRVNGGLQDPKLYLP